MPAGPCSSKAAAREKPGVEQTLYSLVWLELRLKGARISGHE